MDLMGGLENSVRMSKEKRLKTATRRKSLRRKRVRSLTANSVNAHVRRIARPHLEQVAHNMQQMFPRPAYYPACNLQPQFNPSTVGYGAMSAPEVFSAGGNPCLQPIFYAITPPARRDKRRKERIIRVTALATPKKGRKLNPKELPKMVAQFRKQRDQFLSYLQTLQKQLENMEMPDPKPKKKDSSVKKCKKCGGSGGKKCKGGKGSAALSSKKRSVAAAAGDNEPKPKKCLTRKVSADKETMNLFRMSERDTEEDSD